MQPIERPSYNAFQDDAFERAVLEAVLLNKEAWLEVEQLVPGDFSIDANRRIYTAMLRLAASQCTIDILTVTDDLKRHRDLESIGGEAYVSSLLAGLPDRPLDSLKHYVDRVR